jgi:hypothetical protein
MVRVRRVGSYAALAALLMSSVGSRPTATLPEPESAASVAAAVSWPTSTLLVSEVVTGGASASDEFAELTNAGSGAVDLTGFELVYATSTGGTITRKAAWTTETILGPGAHLLVANASGVYAAAADATYSGGFAATGGAIVLRPIAGEPVDAVGWGDATNAFVEGSAAAAPPAGSGIERLPGGPAGNGVDTNDNAADFETRAPSPQNLASEPAPPPTASPSPSMTPTPTPAPTASPSPSMTPTPTPAPTASPTAAPTPSPSPTAEPSSTPTPSPTPAPTSTPVPTPTATPSPSSEPTPSLSPSPSPSPEPTPPPSPTPAPTPEPTATSTPAPTTTATPSADPITSIADARLLADGAGVTISGTLTTDLGSIESARIGFVQDATAGIALRLDAALLSPFPAGLPIEVTGTLGSFFSLRILNIDGFAILQPDPIPLPVPISVPTGGAGEGFEGSRVTVHGRVTETPSALADGLGITIDDGSGPLRLVASPAATALLSIGTGDEVVATGSLGQRDSSGTGAAGYRLHVTLSGELAVVPAPTPTPTMAPTPTAMPSPTPTAQPTATPSAAPTPTATATPAPAPSQPATTIANARVRPVGAEVSVRGVVMAEAGRLGTPALIAIQDGSAGIIVRLPDGVASPARGSLVSVRGKLTDPYGQLEIRPSASGFSAVGAGTIPAPLGVAGALGEAVEGRLVVVSGTVDGRPTKATSGDITFFVRGTAGAIRIVADASSGITQDAVQADAVYRIVGVVGQRASRKGALDGYRVWARDGHDLAKVSGPAPTTSPGGSSGPGGGSPLPASVLAIADAIRKGEGAVSVEGLVTTGADLLDASGRRIVIEDRTAGLELLLPIDARAPAIGSRVRVSGTMGRAYDAPRLKAETVTVTATGARPLPLELAGSPTAAHEWRLVRVSGSVADVRKLGDRWRAELAVGSQRVVITGLAGAGIPVSAIVEGRRATITGIARRPYPGASDRRWSVVPRRIADVVIAGGSGAAGSGEDAAADPSSGPGAAAAGATSTPNVDLVALADHVGRVVRVGGIVTELQAGGFALDDGTAIGRVALGGPAAEFLPLIEPGDALNATGRVVEDGEAFSILVEDPAGIVRVGDPTADALDPAKAAGAAPGGAAPTPSEGPSQLAGGLLGIEGAGLAGLLGVALLSAASLAATMARRRRTRRRMAARVAGRLAAFAGAEAAERGPSVAERA